MIIETQQEKEDKLYQLMRNPKSTIMVLSPGPQATLVDTYTQEPGSLGPWQSCFLIADLDILRDDEKQSWFNGPNPERYIVFGGYVPLQGDDTHAPNKKKRVGDKGPVSDLMLSDTEVDKVAVSTAFGEGDKL